MPYSGIKSKAVTRKLDRCVKGVRAKHPDLTKSSAIAICRKSMKKSMEPGADWIPVLLERIQQIISRTKKEPTGSRNQLIFTKDLSGADRWVVVASNNYRDRDPRYHIHGELLTKASHQEFVEFLDLNPDLAPEWWCWHTPGTARSKADWWAEVDGFLVLSGTATPEQAAPYMEKGADPVGVSLGLLVSDYDSSNGLVHQYRAYEWSDAPITWAANLGAGFIQFKEKENEMPVPAAKRTYLVEKLGEDKVKEVEGQVLDLHSLLKKYGVEMKDLLDPTLQVTPTETPQTTADSIVGEPEEEVAPPVTPPAAQPATPVFSEAALSALTKSLESIAATQTQITATLAKLAETKAPGVVVHPGKGFDPSQSDATVLGEDAEAQRLKSLAPNPELNWVKAIGPITR